VEIRLPPERWCLNAPNWESLVDILICNRLISEG
jgi:hypothetical protein